MMGYETTKPIFRIAVKSYRRGCGKNPKTLILPWFRGFPEIRVEHAFTQKSKSREWEEEGQQKIIFYSSGVIA
jgi:hypothetical protein